MKKTSKYYVLSALLAALFFFCPAAADEAGLTGLNEHYGIRLDQATIDKGYTVAFGGLKLSLTPGVLSDATNVEIIKLSEALDEPWNLDRLSAFYQFEFQNKAAYEQAIPFYIQFHYGQDDNNYKQVFFYDKGKSAWRPLPTKDYPGENFVRSLIHLPFARIAVFSYPGIMTGGRASWYAHKPGNFAASPDFAAGSKLRVWLENKEKFIDVEVNDYGPDRTLHPDRVIDLEKNAFASLAPLSSGMVGIHIEPLEIKATVFAVDPARGMGAEPALTASSALIMGEDGQVLWQKNAGQVRPLASLTKLVAVKTFFETNPTLDNNVVYKEQDELYNYEHVNKWESARLRLSEGDILSVEDLVYASLAGSANNTVETLVRASGLKRSDFIARMNELVREWGASSTNFIEPSGLAPQNVSSARDYGIISRECLKHPLIAKASIAYEYAITTKNTNKAFLIKNTNNLIRQRKYDIIGSKTGYLDEAGYCLMIKIDSGENDFYVVTMGVDNRDLSFKETADLADFAKRHLLP